MSDWTHSLCEDCWDEKHPDNPTARAIVGDICVCCACEKKHSSGIYVREDPAVMPCHGQHQ
jgi:hypothetical protein